MAQPVPPPDTLRAQFEKDDRARSGRGPPVAAGEVVTRFTLDRDVAVLWICSIRRSGNIPCPQLAINQPTGQNLRHFGAGRLVAMLRTEQHHG